MKIRIFSLAFTLFTTAFCPLSLAVKAPPEWLLVTNKNGIQVYIDQSDTLDTKAFRGKTILTIENPHAITALLNDYNALPSWIKFVSNIEELSRKSNTNRQLRLTTNLIWPLKNRDAILNVQIKQDPKTHDLYVNFENDPSVLPAADNYVRFSVLQGQLHFKMLGSDKVDVTYDVILASDAYVPDWMSTIMLQDAPYFTLQKLKKIIRMPQYQNKHYDHLTYPVEKSIKPSLTLGTADITD